MSGVKPTSCTNGVCKLGMEIRILSLAIRDPGLVGWSGGKNTTVSDNMS